MMNTTYTYDGIDYTSIDDLMEAIKSEVEEMGNGSHNITVAITKPMTWEEMVDKVIEYFEDNDDDFVEVIEELDGWNGYLGDDRIYDKCELDDVLWGKSVSEVLDSLNEWDAYDDYFKYDTWGLSSVSEKDYSDKLDNNFVTDLYEENSHIEVPSEVQELFDEYDRQNADDDDCDNTDDEAEAEE